MQEIIIQSEQSLKEDFLKNISKLNIKFHQIIEKSSNSKELVFLLDNVYRRSSERFSDILSRKIRQEKSIEEHKEILEALMKNDAKLAESLMRKHIENGEEALLQEIKLGENNQKK